MEAARGGEAEVMSLEPAQGSHDTNGITIRMQTTDADGWVEVMVDIETLSTRADAVILQIGAVVFDPKTGTLGEEFRRGACLPQPGRRTDQATLDWWARQQAAGVPMPGGEHGLTSALISFVTWLGGLAPMVKEDESERRIHLWGNGPSFDCAILANAYDWAAVARPWPYWGERCLRTLLWQAERHGWRRPRMHRWPAAHDALADARAEALEALEALQFLERRSTPAA